jgi:CheY-like chemotaxis protein
MFLRFHQAALGQNVANTGTGLGLALCKSLAELLEGTLTVRSEINAWTYFTLGFPWIPLDDAETLIQETTIDIRVSDQFSPTHPEMDHEPEDEKMLVLVAEDHPDMRQYITQLLQAEYSVMTAENGQIALEKAREWVPDLIVTDWMMPEMDGLELLKLLRHDRSTQHIPVVLLTAKAEVANRIAGTETGAEAFLAKPFFPQELLAVIRNQLAHRERLRDRFKSEMLRPDKYTALSMEDQFLADLKVVMEKNLMNEQFGVETMADALAMSRRTLVRKLTAVSGQAPVKFIRAYRLERALQMLKDNTAPIWEIAVKTGFGSASYFTKCFKDHYGISPREAIHHV